MILSTSGEFSKIARNCESTINAISILRLDSKNFALKNSKNTRVEIMSPSELKRIMATFSVEFGIFVKSHSKAIFKLESGTFNAKIFSFSK